MAEYRKLAEEAVANQEIMQERLAGLGVRIESVESMLRSVE
jgi:hypothetical protein